jgi:predicted nucleic acid-binding protein
MPGKMSIFLDTNVLVYWVDKHPFAERAEALLAQDSVISVQVLNEFSNVLRSKRKMPWAEIADISQTLQSLCKVSDLNQATHQAALHLVQRYNLHIYDANIVASAAQMRCEVLYSEDMQHGMSIQIPATFGGGSLSIKNPFL